LKGGNHAIIFLETARLRLQLAGIGADRRLRDGGIWIPFFRGRKVTWIKEGARFRKMSAFRQ